MKVNWTVEEYILMDKGLDAYLEACEVFIRDWCVFNDIKAHTTRLEMIEVKKLKDKIKHLI